MRRLQAPGYTRRGVAAGVTFLYFVLLAVPVFFFGSALAVDFTKAVIAARQVANATQAAALAGAQQYRFGEATVDLAAAKAAAADTFCTAQANRQMAYATGIGSGLSCSDGSVAHISVTGSGGSGNAVTLVTVTAQYQVDGMLFTRFFGESAYVANPITRSAAVCVPGQAGGPTGGYCARPGT